MFYVYINGRKKRVLVTTRRVVDREWRLVAAYRWRVVAMTQGRRIADRRDYILEWAFYSRVEN
ncbi:MAG: hypothetical protein ACK4SY_00425 [Pyrobaculum sp.]